MLNVTMMADFSHVNLMIFNEKKAMQTVTISFCRGMNPGAGKIGLETMRSSCRGGIWRERLPKGMSSLASYSNSPSARYNDPLAHILTVNVAMRSPS